jgi:hypothetical protein
LNKKDGHVMVVGYQIVLFGSMKINVVSVYQHPNTSIEQMSEAFGRILRLVDLTTPLLILGDFNCRHPQLGESSLTCKPNAKGKYVVEWCSEHALSILNVRDSWGIGTRGSSVLDLAITNCPDLFSLRIDELPTLSDHSSLTVIVNPPADHVSPSPPSSDLLPPKWKIATADWDMYHNLSQKSAPSLIHSLIESRLRHVGHKQLLVDEMQAQISKAILEWASQAVAKVSSGKVKVSASQRKLNVLLTSAHSLKKKIKRLKERVNRDKRNHDVSSFAIGRQKYLLELGCLFASAKAKWKAASDADSESEWRRRCEKIENSNKRIDFKAFRSTIASTRRRLTSITKSKDAELPGSIEESLNNLALFYSFVMSSEPIPSWTLVPPTPVSPPTSFELQIPSILLNVPLVHSSLDGVITKDEIQTALKGVRTATAPGPDTIHPQFISRASPLLLDALVIVFNTCWDYGVLPLEWKKANACALFKKGNVCDPSSYRIISITSVLIRTFERVWNRRASSFLDEKHFFTDDQAGFRRQLSTADNIYKLLRDMYGHLSRRKRLPILFLDVVKAFDRVPHPHLLFKLFAHAGISGKAWSFINAFLSDRKFRVVDARRHSGWVSATAGTPQGAVNSPLLFAIYINDFVDTSLPVLWSLFADDVAGAVLHRRGMQFRSQMKIMRRCCAHAEQYGRDWGLSFSADKNNIMVVSNSRYAHPGTKPAIIGGNIVACTQSYKYLGIILQDNGKWNAQFDAIASKCKLTASQIGRINNRNRPPSPSITLSLVNSILIPQMTYSLAFWRPTKTQQQKLLQILATPLRRALGLPNSASAIRVLWEFGVPTIPTLKLRCMLQAVLRADKSFQSGNQLPNLLLKDCDRTEFPKSAAYCRPIGAEFRQSITQCPFDKSEIKSLTVKSMTAVWQSSANYKAKMLKPSPELPLYITADTKPLVCVRARLRMGVALTPKRLFLYRVIDSPRCPRCGVEGNARHVLLDCPEYHVSRSVCSSKLAFLPFHVDLTYELLLGLRPAIPAALKKEHAFIAKFHKQCLQITGDFLLSINSRHPL